MTTIRTEELIQTDAMPVRVYRSGVPPRSAPLVFHLHGGAFVGGSLESGRTVASLLADAGAVVVSADYPLAPAHRFPDALEGAFRTLNWLHKSRASLSGRRSSVYVAGEEAGGNLAASLALMARDQQSPPLAGQILFSPMLDPRMGSCSVRAAEAGAAGCAWADGWDSYLGSADKAAHPYASPLGSTRLAGLAPALIVTADDDLLRDEAIAYAQRLRGSGVTVQEHVLKAPTGWPNALTRLANTEPDFTPAVRDRVSQFFAETRRHASCWFGCRS